MSGSTNSENPAARSHYQVVARRYRPQTFEELVGQSQAVRALRNAIEQDRVAHAYLFCGARGVGKTSAARILAKALNCQRGTSSHPCNQCDSCKAISAGQDVDVLEIDGASNRGIDEMRALRQSAGIRPIHARYKIYIIDEVHMLTREAFNALLKTLEEPPEHVKFIFCTTEPEKIPITILSRCQRFDFASIDLPNILERLQQIVDREGRQVETKALQALARRAGGSMRDSQSLLEQLLAFGGEAITAADVHSMLGTADDQRVGRLVMHMFQHETAEVLAAVDAAVQDGVELGQLLDQVLGYLRDLMVAASGGTAAQFLFCAPDQAEELAQLSKQVGLETILAAMQILAETKGKLRYSTQTRILTEMALLRVARLQDLDRLPELIAQLRGSSSSGLSGSTAGRSQGTTARQTKSTAATRPTSASDGQGGSSPPASTEEESEPAPAKKKPLASEPASEEPAARKELSQWSGEELWTQVLDRLDYTAKVYASVAVKTAILAPNRLVVDFPIKYNFQRRCCERPERFSELQQALQELTGQTVAIEFRSVDDDDSTTAAASESSSAEPEMPVPEESRPAESEATSEAASVSAAPATVRLKPDEQMAQELQEERPMLQRANQLFAAKVVRFEQPAGTE